MDPGARAASLRPMVSIGVIAAAGKGTRAYPRTSYVPKPLFRFENRSLLERNVDIQFRVFGVKKLYIVVGHLRDQVEVEVERLRQKFPGREIETAAWTGRGLAADIASLRDRVRSDFSLILGDEFYDGTNHSTLVKFWKTRRQARALIAVMPTKMIAHIRKNYSVKLDGLRVTELIEKPENPPNNLLGLGTYIFSPDYFRFFDETPPSRRSGIVELTDVIDHMARASGEVYAGILKGRYLNINSLADYYAAHYLIRSEKFPQYKLSLVLPALNHAATLPDVISDFKDHVHEIIVADMGSTDGTVDLAKKAKVKVYSRYGPSDFLPGGVPESPFAAPPSPDPRPGERLHDGWSVYEAMYHCSGDIVVLAPADGSFRALDLPKLAEYLKDSDMVVGTRTTRQMMEQGSNLRASYRWMNVAFGKAVEILWWSQEPRYTDIGCMYRAIWKEAFDRIAPDLHRRDKTYSVEMMIEIMRYHMRCIEIPVSYYQGYGLVAAESMRQDLRYFFNVSAFILARRFTWLAWLERVFR